METTPSPVNVGIGTAVQQRPDGKYWGSLTITTDLTAFVIAMPPDGLDALADQLPDALRQCAAEARRLDSGIILATAISDIRRKEKNA